MAMLCVCNCNKRSFAPAAEQQRSTALPWRWGHAIIEKTPSGATVSQGEGHIPWVQHPELDNCMLLDVFIQTLIKSINAVMVHFPQLRMPSIRISLGHLEQVLFQVLEMLMTR